MLDPIVTPLHHSREKKRKRTTKVAPRSKISRFQVFQQAATKLLKVTELASARKAPTAPRAIAIRGVKVDDVLPLYRGRGMDVVAAIGN